MAFYDSLGKKIGRNSPCGNGRKFKHCHGRLINERPKIQAAVLPEEVRQKIAQAEAKRVAFEAAHGKGKPIITTEFKDWRFVAVGNELHYAPKDRTKCFPDFLSNYVRGLLGTDWGNADIAKLLEDRHQILKWYESMCRYQKAQKPEDDGIYRTEANGAMLSWYRLAYDLYLIKHNAVLQEKILDRLRHKDQFQGARFELCVTASMISAGFDINYEKETDSTRKHAEFVATNPLGLRIAVEAKSRHRDGVLEYKAPPRRSGQGETTRVAVEGILRKALAKEPDGPYFIFVDVNLPASEEHSHGNPWFREVAETVEQLKAESGPGTFPANAIFFCNDPTYQAPEEVPKGNNFWCYEFPIENPRHPLPDQQITMHVAQSIIRRTNIPNEFSDS